MVGSPIRERQIQNWISQSDSLLTSPADATVALEVCVTQAWV